METLLAPPLKIAQAGCGWLLRAARYAQRRSREARPLLNGWAILRRYTRHYQRATRAYAHLHGPSAAATNSLVEKVGVSVVDAEHVPFGLSLSPDFQSRVAAVAGRVAAALDQSANCEFFPAVPASTITATTGHVPAVQNGDVISIKLKDPFGIEGLRELCEPILEQLERLVYGSYVIADKVYVYRSPVSRQRPAASWLWHFDNHPREMLKVMIYLTEVTEDTAPFQYLRDRATGRPQLGSPLAPLHGDSRVSAEAIEQRLASSADRQTITGPMGTIVLFDDNVIHRGTLAQRTHRDVIVLQVRPSLLKAEPRIDPRWSGSFMHRDFNTDPHDTSPQLRSNAVGAR